MSQVHKAARSSLELVQHPKETEITHRRSEALSPSAKSPKGVKPEANPKETLQKRGPKPKPTKPKEA